jgi:transposase
MRKTTTYTPEFKAEAMKLVTEQGLSHQEAAAKLGIPTGTLSNWISQRRSSGLGRAAAAPGELTREQLQAEVTRLRRELARAEMEREIVKKAAAYFAKESLQGTRS